MLILITIEESAFGPRPGTIIQFCIMTYMFEIFFFFNLKKVTIFKYAASNFIKSESVVELIKIYIYDDIITVENNDSI